MRADLTQAGQIVGQQGLWPSMRRRVALVAALLVWIGGVIVLEWIVDHSPLEQSISLDPPGVIDTKVWIPLQERYFLLFWFSPQGHSGEQLKQLLGDPASPTMTDGVPVAISWSLTSSKTKATVAQGTTVAKGVWAGGAVYRLVDAIRVEPGQYQFHARIVNPVPQLASIQTRLKLWNTFKTRDTWQSSVLFWGTLFTVWIVTPVTVLLVLWLMGFVGLHYLRSCMNGSDRPRAW